MTGCPDCGLPLCDQCIDTKTSPDNDSSNATDKKKLFWHKDECDLLKKNSVKVSLEEKDEKEASKVILSEIARNHFHQHC